MQDTSIYIQKFYAWLETNELAATDIALWHAINYVASTTNTSAWLSIPLVKLTKLTGMKKDAIYASRTRLEEKGLIELLVGKGNQAAKYKISFTYPQSCETSQDTEEKIEKIEEKKNPLEMTVFKKMQELIIMPSPIDIDTIRSYLEDGMENELLIEAVNISERELQGKKPTDKWRYAKGIMRNWFNDGVKTISQYQENEKAREEMVRSGGDKQNNKHVPGRKDGTLEVATGGMREFRVPGDE